MEHQLSHAESTPASQLRNLFSVDEFVLLPEFSYLTTSSLRHLIFNSRPRYSAAGDKIGGNGLVEGGVIVRIGRKILIDAGKFRAWTNSQREILH